MGDDGFAAGAINLKDAIATPIREFVMLGTIVNAGAIVIGGLIGLLFHQGIAEKYQQTIFQGVGLSVILIGWKSALAVDNLLIVIVSMVVGAVLGEGLDIEDKLEKLGTILEARVAAGSSSTGSFARGFVTASLVFCVGSMAIVGSLESGLTGTHQTLYAKSVLDGVISVVFASAMGLGVLFSSLAVFLYQGLMTLAAVFRKPFLAAATVAQMTSVGGLLIVAIGINMLGMVKIRVGNLVPAIFLPLIYHLLTRWLA